MRAALPLGYRVRYWPLLMTCMRCYTPPRRRSVLLASPDINRAYLVSILHRVTQEPMSLAPRRCVHSDPALKRAATSHSRVADETPIHDPHSTRSVLMLSPPSTKPDTHTKRTVQLACARRPASPLPEPAQQFPPPPPSPPRCVSAHSPSARGDPLRVCQFCVQ